MGTIERDEDDARYAEAGRHRERRRADRVLGTPVGTLRAAREVVTIPEDESVRHAARRMVAQGVGACCVVAPDGRLLGIVTERDFLREILAPGRDVDRVPVRICMHSAPVTLGPDAPAGEAFRAMDGGRRFRHVPIVDVEGRPVGMVSVRDLAELACDAWPEHLRGGPPAGAAPARAPEGE